MEPEPKVAKVEAEEEEEQEAAPQLAPIPPPQPAPRAHEVYAKFIAKTAPEVPTRFDAFVAKLDKAMRTSTEIIYITLEAPIPPTLMMMVSAYVRDLGLNIPLDKCANVFGSPGYSQRTVEDPIQSATIAIDIYHHGSGTVATKAGYAFKMARLSAKREEERQAEIDKKIVQVADREFADKHIKAAVDEILAGVQEHALINFKVNRKQLDTILGRLDELGYTFRNEGAAHSGYNVVVSLDIVACKAYAETAADTKRKLMMSDSTVEPSITTPSADGRGTSFNFRANSTRNMIEDSTDKSLRRLLRDMGLPYFNLSRADMLHSLHTFARGEEGGWEKLRDSMLGLDLMTDKEKAEKVTNDELRRILMLTHAEISEMPEVEQAHVRAMQMQYNIQPR